MKKINTFALFLCAVLAICFFAACAAGADKITITKLPDKVEYEIGEEFLPQGGEITATMDDGTEEVISLTDERVEISSVNMNKSGKKSITVSFEGARARLFITVKPILVTFDLGGHDLEINPLELKTKGRIASKDIPKNPACDGFIFDGWFMDEQRTEEYSASMVITKNTVLYAKWLDMSATYYTVTFDQNYFGARLTNPQNVKEGDAAVRPSINPSRVGYSFNGWFKEASGTAAYDFATPITEHITVYAQWTLTATGTNQYIFEGEHIDFTGKEGKGYSGDATEWDMVESDPGALGASGGEYINYAYVPGMTFEFEIASDRQVTDASIVLRISTEIGPFVLSKANFGVSLNGVPLNYAPMNFTEASKGTHAYFCDFTIATNITLEEGKNTILLSIDNNIHQGGTMGALAPMIDCIKVTTSAVLWWNGALGFPFERPI